MSEVKDAEKSGKTLQLGRYEFFKLADDWVKVLKRTEDGKGLTTAELIRKSMDDILSGAVDAEEIEKKRNKLAKAGSDEAEGEGEKKSEKKEKDEKSKADKE